MITKVLIHCAILVYNSSISQLQQLDFKYLVVTINFTKSGQLRPFKPKS